MTRNIAGCAVGQVLYTPWCDEDGKVLDDGTVARLEPNLFRVTAADPNLRWFQANALGMDVEVHDSSEETAALALQGPSSRAILESLTGESLTGVGYYRGRPAHIGGQPVYLSRTGYTGDLGFEIWVEARDSLFVWDRLVQAGQAYSLVPAGILALDIARVEAGLLLLEVDYVSSRQAVIESQKSSPFEIGLGWAVALDKGCDFIGRRALTLEKTRGSTWGFVGLEMEWGSLEALYSEVGLPVQLPGIAWRGGTPVYHEGEWVGRATSGCWSPILKKPIAIGQLLTAYCSVGQAVDIEVTVEHVRRQSKARVVPLPFFDPPRKRA
jgi:aminomethyltransferase